MATNKFKYFVLALRLAGSLIFITAGFNHLFRSAAVALRLEKAKLGFLATSLATPENLVALSGIALLAGGLMLFLGYKTRIVAMLLLFIIIPITATVQPGSAATLGPLFKNIALMGMLSFFISNGAMYYGLDQLSGKKISLNIKKYSLAGLFSISGLFLFSSCSSFSGVRNSTAEQADSTVAKNNYAVLISQPDHLKAAVHTAQTMRKDARYRSGEFIIMACGKSVEAFTNTSEMKAVIEAGKQAGVTYKVCGLSLEKFKINPGTILESTEITPNGLTFMFELKLKGFITVEL